MADEARTYSKAVVWKMFNDAGVHGRYTTLLKREGIQPREVVAGILYYPADQIDELIKMVKL